LQRCVFKHVYLIVISCNNINASVGGKAKRQRMTDEQTSRLKTILQNFGVISEYSQNLFSADCTFKEYQKGKILFTEDKKNTTEYLVLNGVLHRFNVDDNGENVTTGFYLKNTIITPHFARTVKNKSIFSLQTLTELQIVEIPVIRLDNLRHTNQEFRTFGQRILEFELSKNLFNEVTFRCFNAKDRLIQLRKDFPNLENLIPHNIIASYLGITNVSFSRLRSEFAKQ
jgi:CRP-like cAMP-binding protein